MYTKVSKLSRTPRADYEKKKKKKKISVEGVSFQGHNFKAIPQAFVLYQGHII